MTKQTTTDATCDRCGVHGQVYVRDGTTIDLPFGWSTVRHDVGTGTNVFDLCPPCSKSFEGWRSQQPAPQGGPECGNPDCRRLSVGGVDHCPICCEQGAER